MKRKIRFLHLYRETYRVYQQLLRVPKCLLVSLAGLNGLDLEAYQTKKQLAKGLIVASGTCIPVNFEEW